LIDTPTDRRPDCEYPFSLYSLYSLYFFCFGHSTEQYREEGKEMGMGKGRVVYIDR
jgi:hypothetical protein